MQTGDGNQGLTAVDPGEPGPSGRAGVAAKQAAQALALDDGARRRGSCRRGINGSVADALMLKRMLDRGFSETDLREMMGGALGLRRSAEPGRWIVETLRDAGPWEVVVEPDAADRLLVVITA